MVKLVSPRNSVFAWIFEPNVSPRGVSTSPAVMRYAVVGQALRLPCVTLAASETLGLQSELTEASCQRFLEFFGQLWCLISKRAFA